MVGGEIGRVNRRWATVAVVACVLLAGCGGSDSPPPTPENPQTTVDTPEKTLPDPLYRIEVRGRSDEPVRATVRLTSVDNETVYYETELLAGEGTLGDFSDYVENRTRFRATVSVHGDTVTRVVGPEEGYTFSVQNASDIDVHELPDG